MNKLELYYPILNIIREESKRYEYKPYVEQHIVVIDEDGNEYARISMYRFAIGKEWTGRYDANGGYLVVRRDGEIVCYHFYNQNDVEDYLYNNTRFERASRSRYNFGSLYRGDDGEMYIKLNLQIRFKK